MNKQTTLDNFGLYFDNCFCDICNEIKDRCKAYKTIGVGFIYICKDCMREIEEVWEVGE